MSTVALVLLLAAAAPGRSLDAQREGSAARASATVLLGFATEDMELSAGFGRVLALSGDLPADLEHLVFTWLTRFGDPEGTSFTAVAGHAIPAGPVFATVDLSLQVVVARGFWITTRAASHFGGYLLGEVGIRSRVAESGTYLRAAAGAHAFATGLDLCPGETCTPGVEAVPSPSLSLGVEWR